MGIFVIELLTLLGSTVGTKIVKATSVDFIRAHPSNYVGPGRRIGRIIKTRYRTEEEAIRGAQRAHGYRVVHGTRVYDRKPKSGSVFDLI